MDALLNVLTRPPDQSPFFSTPNGGHLGVFDSTDVVIMVLHAASVHAVDRNTFRSALLHEDVFRRSPYTAACCATISGPSSSILERN
jgi:hypothetical protein